MLTLEVPLYNKGMVIFTRRSARSARTAGSKIALRSPHLSVYFFCLFVRLHLSRAHYVCHMLLCNCSVRVAIRFLAVYSRFAGHCKLQQMKVVVCCLHGENVVGSCKDPVFVAN